LTKSCKNFGQSKVWDGAGVEGKEMTGLFLTPEQLTELTGFKTSGGHAKWLEKNRWRFVLTRSKQPRVSLEYFYERMGSNRGKTGLTDQMNQAAALVEPDFSALNRV
jgi:Domain of unknown function (DUF4224)